LPNVSTVQGCCDYSRPDGGSTSLLLAFLQRGWWRSCTALAQSYGRTNRIRDTLPPAAGAVLHRRNGAWGWYLGVDDFRLPSSAASLRLVLVDLAVRRPIDVHTCLIGWGFHPGRLARDGRKVICRDRGLAYPRWATLGAPHAVPGCPIASISPTTPTSSMRSINCSANGTRLAALHLAARVRKLRQVDVLDSAPPQLLGPIRNQRRAATFVSCWSPIRWGGHGLCVHKVEVHRSAPSDVPTHQSLTPKTRWRLRSG